MTYTLGGFNPKEANGNNQKNANGNNQKMTRTLKVTVTLQPDNWPYTMFLPL